MKIDIITLFPDMFKGPFDESILRRAQDKNQVQINIHNLRKWAKDKRGTVDDRPYGGGVGMVMMVAPIAEALGELKVSSFTKATSFAEVATKAESADKQNSKIVLLSPKGKVWKQELAVEYSKLEHLILICGHYEGVDERVKEFIDEEISIGDFVLTGGELPAMVLVDSVVRLIPGVLEKPEAIQFESFSSPQTTNHQSLITNHQLLEYPQYTHPENFRELRVPEILLSGNHGEIEKWRNEKSLEITKKNRPDLINNQV